MSEGQPPLEERINRHAGTAQRQGRTPTREILCSRIRNALARYCRNLGITKTAVLERVVQLQLKEARANRHPAFVAFERVRDRLARETANEATAEFKRHLDQKYPA